MKDITKTINQIILIGTAIIFGFLTVFAVLISYVNVDLNREWPEKVADSFLLNIIWLMIAVVALFGFHKLCDRVGPREKSKCGWANVRLLIAITCTVLSLCWIITNGTGPQADQYLIIEAANNFNNGDYSFLQKGEYIGINQQQLGIVTVLRILFLIFGPANYFPFQILNACSVFFIIYLGSEIVGLITKKNTASDRFVEKAQLLYCIIVAICLPIYFYTPFVYGDLLSAGLMIVAIYILIDSFKLERGVCIRLILLLFILLFSLAVRTNSIIAIIAMCIVLIISMVSYPDKRRLVGKMLVVVILAVIVENVIIHVLYDKHIDEDSHSIPAVLYIAMGMNDSKEPWFGAGWYDGTNNIVFKENNYDVEATKKEAGRMIRDFKEKSVGNPEFLADFYLRKITSQWEAPMYQSLAVNNNVVKKQGALAAWIYDNVDVRIMLEKYMNHFQIFIYVGVFLYAVMAWKNKQTNIIENVGLLTILGGFLFSILWEAKVRYVFPYFIIMIPYAVVGWRLLMEQIKRKDEFI